MIRNTLWVVALVSLSVTFLGCATPGPGTDCDPCASAEASPVGPGSQAAAAAAAGGQRANQAPFADDTARLSPQTTVGRGAGATTSNSADNETRHVVSGGAQNCGVILPSTANANNSGGTNPAIAEAARTVASYRAMLQCALLNPMTTSERIELLTGQLAKAQESLAQAQAAATVTHVTNNNFQSSRINQIPFSSSSSDGRPQPETVGPVAKAAETVGTAVFSDEMYEDSSVPSIAPQPVPVAPDSLPDSPPAGAVPEVPSDD